MQTASELPVAQAKAELFKALAHPARIRVLEVLAAGERPASDLAAEVGLELSHLSQHLRVLRRTGVVTTRRIGTTVLYALRDERMSQLLSIARAMLVTSLRDSRAILDTIERSGS